MKVFVLSEIDHQNFENYVTVFYDEETAQENMCKSYKRFIEDNDINEEDYGNIGTHCASVSCDEIMMCWDIAICDVIEKPNIIEEYEKVASKLRGLVDKYGEEDRYNGTKELQIFDVTCDHYIGDSTYDLVVVSDTDIRLVFNANDRYSECEDFYKQPIDDLVTFVDALEKYLIEESEED